MKCVYTKNGKTGYGFTIEKFYEPTVIRPRYSFVLYFYKWYYAIVI